MPSEIERRIESLHPDSLKALAQEVAEVFAPVIDAMNVGLVLQQKTFQDPDQFINRLEKTLSNLVDTMQANLKAVNDNLALIEEEHRLFREALKELDARVRKGEPDHGKSG